MNKILIIEDDQIIRGELLLLLKNNGYSPTAIENFTAIPEQIKADLPDLILLDVNLPDNNGFTLCSQIRSFTDTPIIFITGRDTPMDELQGLMLGADDYITKPYHIPILLARISLLLRRGQTAANGNSDSGYLEHRGVTLYYVEAILESNNEKADLTKTELKMLHHLFTNPNQFIPRSDLVEYLWDNDIHIDDNALSVNMSRIRDKLKSIGVEDFITTKRGMGYKI